MNRECRNCAHCLQKWKRDHCETWCTKQDGETLADWFCNDFRPYTEKVDDRPSGNNEVAWNALPKEVKGRFITWQELAAENTKRIKAIEDRLDQLEPREDRHALRHGTEIRNIKDRLSKLEQPDGSLNYPTDSDRLADVEIRLHKLEGKMDFVAGGMADNSGKIHRLQHPEGR